MAKKLRALTPERKMAARQRLLVDFAGNHLQTCPVLTSASGHVVREGQQVRSATTMLPVGDAELQGSREYRSHRHDP